MAEKNEIEILVKAEVTKALTGLKSLNTETGKLTASTEKQGNSFEGLAGKAGKVVAVIAGMVAGFVAAVKIGTKFADIAAEQTAVLSKLNAIARNTGISFTALNQAANQLSSDGLISFNDAADSLANLLSKGMNLDQAIKLINTFKDSASVARPAHLALGEAVRLTTEGIRNENSILTDSSGIQKNYAAILADGARALGVKAESLTDSQKAQIIYNGFLKEGQVFEGKAAEASNTYAGAKARATASTKELAIAIGNFLTPIMKTWQELVAEVTKGLAELFGPKTQSEADKLQFQIQQNQKVIDRFKQKIADNNKEMASQIQYMKDVQEESQTWTKANQDNQRVIDELTQKNKELEKSLKGIIAAETAAAESTRKKREQEQRAAEEARKRAEKEKELQDTLKSIRDKGGDAELNKINELLKLKGLSADAEITLNQRKNDILREQEKKRYEEEEKLRIDALEKERQKAATIVSLAQSTAGAVGAIGDLAAQIVKNQVDEEIAKNKEMEDAKRAAVEKEFEAGRINADQKKKLLEEIDKEEKAFETEKKRRMRDAAIAQKAIAIAQSVINTAAAVVAALVNPVPGVGIATAIAAGITGAAQTALIAATPIPEFAEGGLVEGPFPAMVGHGREAILPASLTNLLLEAAGAGGSSSTTNNDTKNITLNAYGIQDPVAFINKAQRVNGGNVFGGFR